ncbi:hypothetical protein [Saccharopolyspora sp. NPDC050642]|uniref:hypothetical protein n=1 Tax=Saccharopolyspora sp. NPDC050642 TaxID=3157099 RepID=UPI0033C0347C
MSFVRKDHGVGRVRVRYRRCGGEGVDTTLDRVVVDDVVHGCPVREFRWYKGRRHYSGWYYSSTVDGLVVYESRLELARILLADFDREGRTYVGRSLRRVMWSSPSTYKFTFCSNGHTCARKQQTACGRSSALVAWSLNPPRTRRDSRETPGHSESECHGR